MLDVCHRRALKQVMLWLILFFVLVSYLSDIPRPSFQEYFNYKCDSTNCGTSTRDLKILVAVATNQALHGVKKLVARKFGADNIFISTHASDAREAFQWQKLLNFQISWNKIFYFKSPCQMCVTR